jgi:DNA repair protein RadC
MSNVCKECGSIQYAPANASGEKLLRSPQSVFELCRRMRGLKQEHFRVLALDVRLHLLRAKTVAVGSLTECPVHPREILRFLIKSNAASSVVVHNHPSGDPSPSVEDGLLTTRLQSAGELMGIKIVDHVIVARRGYFSFRESGRL